MKTSLTHHHITEDGAGEWMEPVQIPETPLEIHLLRCAILCAPPVHMHDPRPGREGKPWEFRLRDYLSEGWFECRWDEPGDPLDLLNRKMIRGKVRVVERRFPASGHYRIIIHWEVEKQPGILEAQDNYAPYPPVLCPETLP